MPSYDATNPMSLICINYCLVIEMREIRSHRKIPSARNLLKALGINRDPREFSSFEAESHVNICAFQFDEFNASAWKTEQKTLIERELKRAEVLKETQKNRFFY